MRIQVKLRDGQVGTIDASEFDPNSMEQVQSAPQQIPVAQPTQPTAAVQPEQQVRQSLAGRAASGAVNDIGGIIKGVASIPLGYVDAALKGKNLDEHTGNLAISMGKGLVNQYADLFGVTTKNNKPILPQDKSVFKKGGVNAPTGANVDKAVNNAIDHPVNTALSVLPFTKLLKGSKAATAVEDTTALSKTSKIATKLEDTAKTIDEGTRQIKQKASVYGASNEKAINATLNKYKIKGSAQQQYEQLQPTMQKIEGEINRVITDSPATVIKVNDIKSAFQNNLKSALRSKDITNKQAVAEIDGYLKDLNKASGGTGKFTDLSLEKLREMKKLVNEDYGPVHELMDRGGALSARQKVIAAAWDSLDAAVKNASPEMKTLLRDESNLYKSAQSLSSARSNPPTLRAAGFSIPNFVTQGVRDVSSAALRTGAKMAGGPILPKMPSMDIPPAAGPLAVGAALPSEPGVNSVEQSQEQIPNVQDDSQRYDVNGNAYQGNPSISQTTMPTMNGTDVATTPEAHYVTGFSPEDLYQGYLQALQAGDKANASALRQMYTDETAYQTAQAKLNPPKTKKPLSGPNSVLYNKANTAVKALDRVEQVLKSDPNVLIKKLNPLNQSGRQLGTDITSAIDLLGFFRTGATITPEQRKDYIYLFPDVADDPQTKAVKIQRLREEFQGYIDGLANSGDAYDPYQAMAEMQAGTMPALQ